MILFYTVELFIDSNYILAKGKPPKKKCLRLNSSIFYNTSSTSGFLFSAPPRIFASRSLFRFIYNQLMMQIKSLFSQWTKVAAILLIGGALAWTIKLGVIVSTNGAIIDTGAAALFMKIGLVLLLIGSTGIGSRLGKNRQPFLRIIAILLSPVILIGLIFLFGFIMGPLFKNTSIWYAEQEAPILIAVMVSLVVGSLLLKSLKPVVR